LVAPVFFLVHAYKLNKIELFCKLYKITHKKLTFHVRFSHKLLGSI
jgi:hypothetical protein